MAWWKFRLGREARIEAPAAEVPPPTARGVLGECCTFRAAVTLVACDSGRRVQARFASLRDQEVVLDVLPGSAAPLPPLAICCASFVHRGRAAMFLTHVRRGGGTVSAEGPAQMTVRVPSQIVTEDLRAAPRVPVGRGSGLVLAFDLGDRRAAPAVLNLSPCGALVELEEDFAAPDEETELRVHLRLGDDALTLRALVRRRDGPRLGLLFPDVLRDGEVRAPETLARIVAALSARWTTLYGRRDPGSLHPLGVAGRV